MSPKRGAYPADFRADAVRKLREGRSMGDLARELGVTTTTLKVWLTIADGGSHRARPERETVIRLTDEAFGRLDATLRSVPVSELAKPMKFVPERLDPWRVKDAISHVTHYKARVAHRLARDTPIQGISPRAGLQMDQYFAAESWRELESSDKTMIKWDERTRRRHGRNHLVYVRWRDEPPTEVLAWHRAVHRYVIAALKSAPNSYFDGKTTDRSLILSNDALGALGSHVDTHLRDIRSALESKTARRIRRGKPD